jgi:hypothetical protein
MSQMDHHKVEIRLLHRVDVSEAAKYLLVPLDCDDWYVVCQHEHLLVIQLSKGGIHQYAVRFECSAPVEKGVFHGSRAWSLSIIPLTETGQTFPGKLAEIKAGLDHLG